jgi:hypothetical protein
MSRDETGEKTKMDSKLQAWVTKHSVRDEMLWKGAWGEQIRFVRDHLLYLVGSGLHFVDLAAIPDVISTHTSKSILLPVYELSRDDIGLRLILRHNFHDWKLSVISERPIVVDFSGLFHTTPPVAPDYTGNELADVYFEGFPKDLVFGYYESSDKKRWSACIGGQHAVYTTVFLILRSLGVIEPCAWHTPESHKRELDADTAYQKKWEAEHPQHGERVAVSTAE